MDELKFGERLPSGAVVIDARGDIVLALYNGEYVTWRRESSDTRAMWSGCYFGRDIAAAAENFAQRCGLAYGERSLAAGRPR